LQLNDRLAGLKVHRNEKNSVLKEENQERAVLVAEKKEKDAVAAKLRSREKELTKDLAVKKRQDANLKNSIAAAIKREIAAETKKQEAIAKAEAAKNPTTTNTESSPKVTKPKTFSVFDNTAEGKALSENFEKNRNKLPWPLEEGNVSMEFGPQKVLEGSNIVYNNQGLTFETKAGTPVKVVFDGEVSSVFNADDATAVIVRHGKYFTSYSGLNGANVQKGQMVKTGQTIGRVNEKADGIGQLEFIIMTDKLVNLSPRQWLR
jgi:septal ring factor EnvC (AmiA/AmiB activator)